MPVAEKVLPLLDPAPMPYCKGCGHQHISKAIASAFELSGIPRQKLCLVSDIGCVGLVDRLFPTVHTVHTTHGRSPAFAAGIAIADRLLHDDESKVLVVMGDGGATIGLLHLVSAAQLNVDITVIIHNNHLFGMTGGQSSGLTPMGWNTASSLPEGNPLPPLDLVGILKAAGATFLARELATDKALDQRIGEALDHPGFAVVEVLELCTAFGIRWNDITGKKLRELADATGEPLGLAHKDSTRPSFHEAWRARIPNRDQKLSPLKARRSLQEEEPFEDLCLDRPHRILVAGTAGEGVQSAAASLAALVVDMGMFATQKNDNLVTQGTGFSLSELVLSPSPIHYTGIDRADAVLALSQDGLDQLYARGAFSALAPKGLALIDEGLELPKDVDSSAIVRLPLRKQGVKNATLCALSWTLARWKLFDPNHLVEATRERFGVRGRKTYGAMEWAIQQASILSQ